MSNFIKVMMLGSFCISAVYANEDLTIMKKHFFHSDLSFEQFKEREDILKSLNICDMDIEMHPNVPDEFYIALYKKDKEKAQEILNSYLEKRRTQINDLKIEDINAEVKVRGIIQGSKMAVVFAAASYLGVTFFPDSIKKSDVAKAAMIFLIAGYFGHYNTFEKRSFLEFKKQCERMSLISDHVFMNSLLEKLIEKLGVEKKEDQESKKFSVDTDKKATNPRTVRRSGG